VKPANLLLVHTAHTQKQAERLAKVLGTRATAFVETSAYDIGSIRGQVGRALTDRGYRSTCTVVNLTGGTKAMAFALYELAMRLGMQFVYLQSENSKSLLYRYATSGGYPELVGDPENLEGLLTLDAYIRVHAGIYELDDYSKGDGGYFESAIHEAIGEAVDEVLANVRFDRTQEVDFVLRRGNVVAVAEAKLGKPSKDGLDQLTAICSREYLGTFTRRVLITGRSWSDQDGLLDLAKARSISLIELPGYSVRQSLGDPDRATLITSIKKLMA
jgi:hypothetical protein